VKIVPPFRMKRPVINILAILLLSVGVWIGVRSLSPPPAAVEGDRAPTPARTQASARAAAKSPSPAPILIRRLSDPALHRAERIAAIRELPSDLSSEENQALMDLLRQPAPERVGISTWYMVLNEIMEVLRQPRFDWPGYGEAMADLMTDRHVDPVVRDYSAQHLALYLGDEAETRRADSFSPGMDAFLSVLRGEREAHEEVTGTILMALCDLKSKRPAEDFAAYDEPISLVVTDFVTGTRQASRSNRISAIQAAGRMGYREALPTIRAFARDGAPEPSLRLSSIAALGYFSDPEDRPFLQQLARSDDRLRFAATAALKNFNP
jgi:hypothetical protein